MLFEKNIRKIFSFFKKSEGILYDPESIRERLYENSSILLNSLEKKKYLEQWEKEIKQQFCRYFSSADVDIFVGNYFSD